MPTVPVDGRPQFDPVTIWLTNAAAGRWLTTGVEKMTVGGKYILQNTWPTPKPSAPSSGGFSGLAATAEAPAEVPKSSPQARAVWPQLR
jgi:hypothetical protein